jgi:hypothetical protein
VLMQPAFASKYGVAQPLSMAFGQRWLFTPRAGILLCMALAAASLCWMLQAYLPPEWAFLGGLLAVIRISWFSYFGNTYWGGAAAILGGCLLMGAAARLQLGLAHGRYTCISSSEWHPGSEAREAVGDRALSCRSLLGLQLDQ